jgi:NADH-quinone oxidoreductase subunit L
MDLNLLPFAALMLPLIGFVVLALFGDAINRHGEQKGATVLACLLVVLSFAASVRTAMLLPAGVHETESKLAQDKMDLTAKGYRLVEPPHPGNRYEPGVDPGVLTFIDVDGLQVPLHLLLDPLSLTLMLVITGIGSLIHIYSLGYMAHDDERVRYFSYLNLFTFFMLLLVTSASLPLMFVGWEGVGLCSYLLIGFWFKKPSASDAGKKAFIVNRIGDAGLILGMALAFYTFGTLDLATISDVAAQWRPEPLGTFAIATPIALLLFIGACGKSAQIPLHVWLPDAMEGPTPVSALIHAATMVTAGVYMVARLGSLYRASETALLVVAVIGTATALMAATIALVQTDIKKVLAYSTVSQLGYMFLACGLGAFSVGVFHLFTHAFFKALLFLGSGSVIHALSGEQDLRKMGGLAGKIPWTFATFAIGTVAIAGIPPFAGFFSKDMILEAAYEHHQWLLFGVGLLTAVLTAFYMTRLLVLAFFGTYRGELESGTHAMHVQEPIAADDPHGTTHVHAAGDHGHGHGGIHESPWSMLLPLVLLAIGSTVVGFVPILRLLTPPGDAVPEPEAPGWLPFLAIAGAAAGMIAAFYCYLLHTEVPARVGRRFAWLRRVFEAKWGFDDFSNWVARRLVVDGSRDVLWTRVDVGVIDALVNGAGTVTAAVGQGARAVQSGLVRAYALLILGGAVAVVGYLLWTAR